MWGRGERELGGMCGVGRAEVEGGAVGTRRALQIGVFAKDERKMAKH